jgi:CDP-glycerol glycerophosphotransferase (TagB/SpsB family)
VYEEKIKNAERGAPLGENPAFTILVSPSWGNGSLLNVFGASLLDPLVKTSWRIIVRPHPQSKKSEADTLATLEERYRGAANVVWDYSAENLEALAASDIMISDFSGIIFDYIFLFDKPVIYANVFFTIEMYDASDLDHLPWRFEVVKTFGKELKGSDLEKLPDIIREAAVDERAALARRAAKDIAWQFAGEADERAVDFLTAKRKELCHA